ncbi:MAG: hypothetical protein JWQ81_1045 [Amycolatopsis sp.]|uniref:hypothetical protein n=1 Tax=Amycolatopsis sp. TaxID=37632 RepID=UPI002616CB06|nr:hypothetical protein [Amycolatopsis sp.]MCU1680306.1 hypothetical protein [Amycolatopsis sp.]
MFPYTAERPAPPRLASAYLTLGHFPTDFAPWWAAHWLVDGYDGPALRELAGLSASEPPQIHDLLPSTFAEMRIAPLTEAAAAELVFNDLARLYLAGLADELQVIGTVEQLVSDSAYSDALLAPPLAELCGFYDEWESGGWGRPQSELATFVRESCVKHASRGSWDSSG